MKREGMGEKMKRFFRILGKNALFFILTLFVGLLFSALSVSTPLLSGNLITAVTSDFGHSGTAFFLFLSASVVRIIFAQLDQYMGESLKIRQKSQMRKKLYAAFSMGSFVHADRKSEMISFINNDVPNIAESYILGAVDILKCISLILIASASLLSIHWILAVIIIGISVLILVLPKALRARSGNARTRYSQQLSRYHAQVLSFLSGLPVMKAYSYRRRSIQIHDDTNSSVQKSEAALLKCRLWVYGATATLQVVKTAAILCVGAILIANQVISIGSLVAVLQLAEVIGSPIEVLAYLFHSRNEVLPLVEQYDVSVAGAEKSGKEEEAAVLSCSEIRLENISYQIDGIEILKDVTVSFRQGKKYLITGESGSGKSTLLRLISRIGDQSYSGSIFCGDADIRTIPEESFYSAVCVVFQEPYLFHSTLEENIILGRAVSKAAYLEVIEKLNLSYLIERYGEREITAEDIESFSGGERQRIALARAMVGKPKVYLLDEITSSLDRANSEMVEKLILEEKATVVHIAHKSVQKLAPLYDAHYILKDGVLQKADEKPDD